MRTYNPTDAGKGMNLNIALDDLCESDLPSIERPDLNCLASVHESIFRIKSDQQKIITVQFLSTFHQSGEFPLESPLIAYVV